MNNAILTTTKSYLDENNISTKLCYRLLSRSTPIGTVYDIACKRIAQNSEQSEIYTGVTQNHSTALKIFNILSDNLVAPEHLICIIDEMYAAFPQ